MTMSEQPGPSQSQFQTNISVASGAVLQLQIGHGSTNNIFETIVSIVNNMNKRPNISRQQSVECYKEDKQDSFDKLIREIVLFQTLQNSQILTLGATADHFARTGNETEFIKTLEKFDEITKSQSGIGMDTIQALGEEWEREKKYFRAIITYRAVSYWLVCKCDSSTTFDVNEKLSSDSRDSEGGGAKAGKTGTFSEADANIINDDNVTRQNPRDEDCCVNNRNADTGDHSLKKGSTNVEKKETLSTDDAAVQMAGSADTDDNSLKKGSTNVEDVETFSPDDAALKMAECMFSIASATSEIQKEGGQYLPTLRPYIVSFANEILTNLKDIKNVEKTAKMYAESATLLGMSLLHTELENWQDAADVSHTIDNIIGGEVDEISQYLNFYNKYLLAYCNYGLKKRDKALNIVTDAINDVTISDALDEEDKQEIMSSMIDLQELLDGDASDSSESKV
ncbi:uncharacterized protein LOC120347558 [Styela clava]